MTSEKLFYNFIIPSGERKQAEVKYNFNKTLINNPQDYKFIINKFSFDGMNNPICIPRIKNPQSLKTSEFETIYNIYLVYGDDVFSENIKFSSDVNGCLINPIKQEGGLYYYDNSDKYFHVHSYEWWIDCINKALHNIFSNYMANKPVGAPSIVKPILKRVFPDNYIQIDNVDNVDFKENVKILFSESLKRFINISCVEFAEGYKGINELTFCPFTETNYGQSIFSNVNEWSPIRAIVLTSNTINTNPEYFANGYEFLSKSNQLQSEKIIMVFNIAASESGNSDQIIYSNNNLMNGDLLDIVDSRAINSLDIKAWFVDEMVNWHPIVLNSYGSAFIRCCFIKK